MSWWKWGWTAARVWRLGTGRRLVIARWSSAGRESKDALAIVLAVECELLLFDSVA